MNIPTPHFFLFSQANRGSNRDEWSFVLKAADGSAMLKAADAEPEAHGERLELLAVVRRTRGTRPAVMRDAGDAKPVRETRHQLRFARMGAQRLEVGTLRRDGAGEEPGPLATAGSRLKIHRIQGTAWRIDRRMRGRAEPRRTRFRRARLGDGPLTVERLRSMRAGVWLEFGCRWPNDSSVGGSQPHSSELLCCHALGSNNRACAVADERPPVRAGGWTNNLGKTTIVRCQRGKGWDRHGGTDACERRLHLDNVGRLIEGRDENPFDLLGPHEWSRIRAGGRSRCEPYLPHSTQAWVVDPGRHAGRPAADAPHPSGRLVRSDLSAADHRLGQQIPSAVRGRKRQPSHMHDPYAFPQLLTEYDLYLLNEGTHWRATKSSARNCAPIDGVQGVNFAVWAPNATSVSVIGDFNEWDGRRHPMRKHIPSGFWELFVPGLGEGTLYKYQSSTARGFENPIPTASPPKCRRAPPRRWSTLTGIIGTTPIGSASDPSRNRLDAPMSFYEVHLGSWRRPGDDPTAG